MTDRIRLEVDNTETHIEGRARVGGTEPPGGDMEQRVRQLETDMSFIKGKLDDMPTKDWVTTRLFWTVGAISLLVALISGVQVWVQAQIFTG